LRGGIIAAHWCPISTLDERLQTVALLDELRATFGDYAQRNWWGVKPDGRSIGLDGVELEGFEPYTPRLSSGSS
jgi:hypothetical protein